MQAAPREAKPFLRLCDALEATKDWRNALDALKRFAELNVKEGVRWKVFSLKCNQLS